MTGSNDISNRDLLLAMHTDIKTLIGSHAALTERVDNVAQKIDDHIDDDDKKHEAIDVRVSKVEDWRQRVVGVLVAVGAGVGFLASVAKDAIAAAWPWGH